MVIRTIDYIFCILPNCGHPLFSKPSKGQENFTTLLLEAEAAITSCCDGCYSWLTEVHVSDKKFRNSFRKFLLCF